MAGVQKMKANVKKMNKKQTANERGKR